MSKTLTGCRKSRHEHPPKGCLDSETAITESMVSSELAHALHLGVFHLLSKNDSSFTGNLKSHEWVVLSGSQANQLKSPRLLY